MAKPTLIKPETGDTKISLNNIFTLYFLHGGISGVIHRRSFLNGEQTTIVFYGDGTIHEATGLTIGSLGEGTQALKTVIQEVPMAGNRYEGTAIAQMGNDPEDLKKAETEKKTIYWLFRSPQQFLIPIPCLKENAGAYAIRQYIKIIAMDANCDLRED